MSLNAHEVQLFEHLKKVLDAGKHTAEEQVHALAAVQFLIAHALTREGWATSRGEALAVISNKTAKIWTMLEALQKTVELKAAVAGDLVAADLIAKTLALSKPQS